MKKVIFSLSAAICCLVISCNDKGKDGDGKMSSTTQKNIEACKAVSKAIESGDVSKLGDYIASDAVDHAGMYGDIKGLDSIKANLAKIHTMAKDMKTESLKVLADDEYVFEWMRFTGTTTSADWGMPAGTKYDMTAIQVSKFKDGKAVEHWEFMQPVEMMKMMGNQEGMKNPTDTEIPPTPDSTH